MKILLVDDHLLFLEGLRLVLGNLPLPTPPSILEAHTPGEALGLLEAHPGEIELALVDLNFPEEDGLEILKTLTSASLLIPVIVLSAEENISRIKQAISIGALGFIPKSLGSEDMVHAITQVLEGVEYIPEEVRARLQDAPEYPPNSEEAITAISRKLGISKRQYDTLLLLAKGFSNKKIAEELFLSEHTVKSHISKLFQQLKASNRTDCILKAQEYNLLEKSTESL